MSDREQNIQPIADNQILLKEYEWCRNTIQNLESLIWQTSAVIGIGSISTFILIANHTAQEHPPWQVALIIGTLVSIASCIWLRMAKRWWSIQHACFLRMRHIEKELKLFQQRYVHFLDNPDGDKSWDLKNSGLPEDQKQEIKDRATGGGHQRSGIQDVVWTLPYINPIVWLFYVGWLFLR